MIKPMDLALFTQDKMISYNKCKSGKMQDYFALTTLRKFTKKLLIKLIHLMVFILQVIKLQADHPLKSIGNAF